MLHYRIHRPIIAVDRYLFPVTNLGSEYFVHSTIFYKTKCWVVERQKTSLVYRDENIMLDEWSHETR